MSQAHAIIARWDHTIASTLAQFDALLAEACRGSEALIATMGDDYGPLERAWTAVEHRRHQHAEVISDGWDAVSDELGEVDGLPEGLMAHEGHKRDRGTTEIEIRYARAYQATMARAAEQQRQRALAHDAGTRSCTQCGATLDRVHPVSQALDVQCGHCTAVNTVRPAQALRMFAASGAHELAQWAALGAWEQMTRAKQAMAEYRDRKAVPLELLDLYRAHAHAYWTTRLGVEAQFVPEQHDYVQRRLDASMVDVQRTLRAYPQWRRHRA